MTTRLEDQRGRRKRKLRISLTDRCNFRCPYCMPETPEWLPREELLSYEELLTLTELFVSRLGISHIRLTGGEPLLRKDIARLITAMQALRELGLQRLSMTTNGILLSDHAQNLKDCGLDDVNVSLDTLHPARFAELSGGRGSPDQVLAGIYAARHAGLPVKLNTVVIRGYNEDDILPLAAWAMAQQLPLRFIEFMPLDGGSRWDDSKVVKEAEILETLATAYQITTEPRGTDPATYYRLNGDYRLGVIPTISNPFCSNCDRLRLTATGELYACLFSKTGCDLRSPLRNETSETDLASLIRTHVWHKEAGYALKPGYVERPITMHALGG